MDEGREKRFGLCQQAREVVAQQASLAEELVSGNCATVCPRGVHPVENVQRLVHLDDERGIGFAGLGFVPRSGMDPEGVQETMPTRSVGVREQSMVENGVRVSFSPWLSGGMPARRQKKNSL